MSKQLARLDDDMFLDANALSFVHFGRNGKAETAQLIFTGGGSASIRGEAARSLRRLIGPENTVPDAPAETAMQIQVPALPMFRRKKDWFYRREKDGEALILAFVNNKGSSSVRPFEAETGRALGKRYASGSYQEQFSSLIEGATALIVDSQPNLERDCKLKLPEQFFAELRKQIERIG